jgi:hypothetical protein
MMKTFPKPPAQTGLLVLLLLLCLFLAAAPGAALAGEPATVTVRVEGASMTLLAPTRVTTTTTPVVKNGNPADSCAGTSAFGALEVATAGDWTGKWEGSYHQYTAESILGESHLFGSGSFWAFYLNDKYSSKGACIAELQPGDAVLFYALPESEAADPPVSLDLSAPEHAQAGEPVSVGVTSYSHNGEPSPAGGVKVEYEGTSTTTNLEGRATLTFAHDGKQTVTVSSPPAIRDEATICVNALGAACGSSLSGSGSKGESGVAGYTGTNSSDTGAENSASAPDAVSARLTSVAQGRRYRRGHAPRVLAGHVVADRPVTVSLSLRRAYHGRCYSFDGSRERFVRSRCGHVAFFELGVERSFSYLLPGPLAPGRYVLELRAEDTSGARTALRLGSTEVVFYVG